MTTTATDQLTRALVNLAAQGLRTHCSDAGTGGLWLSEQESERREAARLCRGCPVLRPCLTAAKAQRETFGVWGGRDFTHRPGRPRS
jgi:Transcription factor WhiB